MANYTLDIVTTDAEENALIIIVARANQAVLRIWEYENLRRAAQDPPLPPLVQPADLTHADYLVNRVADMLTAHAESIGAEEYSALRDKYIAADEPTRAAVRTALR